MKQIFDFKTIKRKGLTVTLALAVLIASIPISLIAMASDADSFNIDFGKGSSDDRDAKLNVYRISDTNAEKVTFADSIANQEDSGLSFTTDNGTSVVMAPKNSLNNDAKLENFEAAFTVSLAKDKKVALTFRSSNKARLYDSKLYSTSGNLASLILTGTGYTVAETAKGSAGETAWNSEITDSALCDVQVKVLGNKLSFSVAAKSLGNSPLADAEVELATAGEGYIYLSVSGSDVAVQDLKVTKLDGSGKALLWNDSVSEESSNKFSAPLKDSCKNPAEIDKTVNVYYDQSDPLGDNHKFIKVDSIADNAKDAKYGGLYETQYTYEDWPLIKTDNWGNPPTTLLKNVTSYVPKLSDGVTEAKVENFEAYFENVVFDFNNMGMAISFRSDKPGVMLNDEGKNGYANKTTLLINQAGWNIYEGTSLEYSDPTIPSENRWIDNTSESGVFCVTLKVVGNKLTLKVYNKDNGRWLYDNTSTPYTLKRMGAGYIYYSMLSNWTWAGPMECQRLDSFGNNIKWDDESYNTPLRQIREFSNNFSDAASIDKSFDVYFDQSSKQGEHKLVKADSVADNAQKYGLPYATTFTGGKWPLINTKDRTGYLLNNSTSYVPKLSDGVTPAKLENFETTFTAQIFKDDTNMGFAINFRSEKPGAVLDDNGHSGYSNKATLFMNCDGWGIYDGTSMPYSYPRVEGEHRWSQANIDAKVEIYLKVVGDKMTFKAVSDSKVLYDNTDNPYTLNMKGSGYIYYSYLTSWSFIGSPIVCKRLDKNGNQIDWDTQNNGEVKITEVVYDKELTFDRSKNVNFSIPNYVTGKDANGNEYSIPVTWSNSDYRSYKDGTFEFTGKLSSDAYDISDIKDLKLTVHNKTDEVRDANGNIASKTWYFDNENDLKDFTCRISGYNIFDAGNDRGKDWHDVKMTETETSKYWKIENGKLVSDYARTLQDNGQIIGTTFSSDTSSLILDKDGITNTLINFKMEVEFTHGGYWWFPYVIYGVQDPSDFWGDLYVNPMYGDKYTGAYTDVHSTSAGGTWIWAEWAGKITGRGGCTMDYYEDFSEGQTHMKNYNHDLKHKMTIKVINGSVSVQVDNSDVYFGQQAEAALGGYFGLASSGTNVAFDSMRLIALDDLGDPMSFDDESNKGFTPPDFVDNYTGWQPTNEEADFKWSNKYY